MRWRTIEIRESMNAKSMNVPQFWPDIKVKKCNKNKIFPMYSFLTTAEIKKCDKLCHNIGCFFLVNYLFKIEYFLH